MFRMVTLGDDSGIFCFVEAGLFKTDAEAFHTCWPDFFGSIGRDRGGIDAAAEKDPQWNIRHEPSPHCPSQKLPELLTPCFFRIFRHMLKWFQNKIPIFGYLAYHSVDFEQQVMASWDLKDLPIKGGRRRYITVGKVFLEAPPRNFCRDLRVADQGAQFGGKCKGLIL